MKRYEENHLNNQLRNPFFNKGLLLLCRKILLHSIDLFLFSERNEEYYTTTSEGSASKNAEKTFRSASFTLVLDWTACSNSEHTKSEG